MLTKKIKSAIVPLVNSFFGLRLRSIVGLHAPAFYPDLSEVVSDLFVWRNDKTWDTRFDLFHIASLINPDFTKSYDVLVHLYDSAGQLIAAKTIEIEPGALKILKLEELLNGEQGVGTFAVFHIVRNADLFKAGGTCLAERGYTSFNRKSDPPLFRSYVHGNSYVLGYEPVGGRVRSIGAPPALRSYFYRPQVSFEDCNCFELLLVNPASRPIKLNLMLYDEDGNDVDIIEYHLPINGSMRFCSSSYSKKIHTVNLVSKVIFLRPMIFTYYQSHFDVFHA
jgi:hypothetical protein